MKHILVLAVALLAGCTKASVRPEPIVVTKEVVVPVAMPCVPDNYDRKRPDYVDSDANLKAASGPDSRYQLLWGGRSQRIAREKENETVIAGCPGRSVK